MKLSKMLNKIIFDARDILEKAESTPDQEKIAEQTIKLNQNVLVKELGVSC